MSRRGAPAVITRIVVAGHALGAFTAVVAPALAVNRAAERGGLDAAHGVDLVAASALLGVLGAGGGSAWLVRHLRFAARRANAWIAAANALVVLAVAATLLLVGVLVAFADQHANLARRGFPVVPLWAGVQIAAVAVAGATRRAVFRWLEPRPAPRRASSPSGVPHPRLGGVRHA